MGKAPGKDSRNGTEEVNIAIVGKYVKLTDSTKASMRHLNTRVFFNNTKVNRVYVDC
jgi:CTP synthase (UTP-ammonia lyase)